MPTPNGPRATAEERGLPMGDATGRNLVVCCDGTSNQFATNNTNVVKLFQSVIHDPDRQLTYYHPGLGTMEAVGALTSWGRKVTKLLGLAIGYGLEVDVVRAYQFVMANYRPGDRLFLFGFSRGAYTVRAVAALLHMFGLLRGGNDDLARYAIRMLTARGRGTSDAERGGASNLFEIAAGFRDTFSGTTCPIHFVGVWDTVSSVGWIANPLSLPYTADNPSVVIARHAVSIDERRAFFRQNLWRPGSGGFRGDVKQVWFPGDHCDVGGGRGPADCGASDVALTWMMREAESAGLLLRPRVSGEPSQGEDAPSPPIHDALTGLWRLAEFVPKRHYDFVRRRTTWRANLFRRRVMPSEALVHVSAFRRGKPYVDRLPPGAVKVD